MTISAVGSMAAIGTTAGAGATTTTVPITTTTIGNAVLLGTQVGNPFTITGIVGGGCSWARLGNSWQSAGAGVQVVTEIWLGTVTSVVTAVNATLTYSAVIATKYYELAPQEFTNGTGAPTVWALDGTQQAGMDTSPGPGTATIPYPSLTAGGTGRLYFAKGSVASGVPAATGTPASGFTYGKDSVSGDPFSWGFPGAGVIAPVQDHSATGIISTMTAALVTASVPGAVPPRPDVLRQSVNRAAFR